MTAKEIGQLETVKASVDLVWKVAREKLGAEPLRGPRARDFSPDEVKVIKRGILERRELNAEKLRLSHTKHSKTPVTEETPPPAPTTEPEPPESPAAPEVQEATRVLDDGDEEEW